MKSSNIIELFKILAATTAQLRKGPAITQKSIPASNGSLEVTEIFAMPHENASDLEKVDLELLTVGVDRKMAEKHRSRLCEILNDYSEPERLAKGLSYIEVGAEIGDQGAAFQLFALGKILGLWDVVTPSSLGFRGAVARQMAGKGMVMITGYKP